MDPINLYDSKDVQILIPLSVILFFLLQMRDQLKSRIPSFSVLLQWWRRWGGKPHICFDSNPHAVPRLTLLRMFECMYVKPRSLPAACKFDVGAQDCRP